MEQRLIIRKEEKHMQKAKIAKECIGDLNAEFIEISKMYEQEEKKEEFLTITQGCMEFHTIACC